MCLRGEACQTYFSHSTLQISNSLILQFYSEFEVFFKMKTWKGTFSFEILSFRFVKMRFVGSKPNFFNSFTLNKIRNFLILTNFTLKIVHFFKWSEVKKYLSDRSEPKCGNGKEHFNFVFSWVKCQNSSYFARYSRELTLGSWLGTP